MNQLQSLDEVVGAGATLLHFEAADWNVTVWLNGALLGSHRLGATAAGPRSLALFGSSWSSSPAFLAAAGFSTETCGGSSGAAGASAPPGKWFPGKQNDAPPNKGNKRYPKGAKGCLTANASQWVD